ncbi:MAG TPA: hypothetical protein VE422_25520 [Terriglobia bacterium]|nr:hypothetical protein [Terriglobia bacterium]
MVLKNLPPLAGLIFNCNAYPTLPRGATLCRRYAAVFGCASRDILDSFVEENFDQATSGRRIPKRDDFKSLR